MFGAFALIDSTVSARARKLPRPLSDLGMVLGTATIVGGVGVLAGPLGLVSLVLVVIWPAWLGITLLRNRPTSAAALLASARGARAAGPMIDELVMRYHSCKHPRPDELRLHRLLGRSEGRRK
jgi:hypothetical protein